MFLFELQAILWGKKRERKVTRTTNTLFSIFTGINFIHNLGFFEQMVKLGMGKDNRNTFSLK